jgi:DNA-binding NtrC family response regulator
VSDANTSERCSTTPAAAHVRRSSVLLVEDEPMLAEVFRRILVSAGFDVTVCRTAMDALLLLEADAVTVDVVVSDVRLPVITGDRLAQQLRRMRPDMPVVLMTGFSATVIQENASALGVAAVLQKPVAGRLLVTAVRGALQGTEQVAGTCAAV